MSKLNYRSLRFRLAAWYLAILALTFAVLGGGIYFAIRRSVQNTVDKELQSRLATVRSYIEQQTPKDDVSHLVEELSEETVLSPAAVHIRIADRQNHWIYQSPGTDQWGSLASRSPTASQPAVNIRTIITPGGRLRVISSPIRIGLVQVGLPLDQFEDLQSDFLWTVLIGAPLLLVCAASGGVWISGRALAPIERMTATAERIRVQNLSDRLPLRPAGGEEIERLSAVLNRMLDRLEGSFSRMTQFTADASHELRTPVAIIRTAAELMSAGQHSPDDHGQSWKIVSKQVERITRLIADLLTLARADAGVEPVGWEQVDLNQIAADASAQMRIVAGTRGLTLHFTGQESLLINADEEAIRRAILIILDNALNATPAGGKIEVTASSAFDSSVSIQVQDTGLGIAAGDLPHIFERFFRADQNRIRKTGGSGLGLAIAKAIVEQHQGCIEAHSKLGQGATFLIRLPRYEQAASWQAARIKAAVRLPMPE